MFRKFHHYLGYGPVILAVLVSGCTTNIVNEFHGELVNLRQDGRTEAVNGEISSYCEGPAVDGRHYVGFPLPVPGASAFIFYPAREPATAGPANAVAPISGVWLVRARNFYAASHFGGDPERLRALGGEPLAGPVTVRWNDNADFEIRVNVSAPDGRTTALRGTFTGFTRLEFHPSLIFILPAMMVFGEGARQPALQPVPATELPANQPVGP